MRYLVVGTLGSVHVERWAQHLAQRGHSVHAFTDVAPPAPIEGVDVHVMGGAGAPKAIRFGRATLELRRLIGRLAPDIVHVQSVGATAILAAAVPARLLVVSPWGSDVGSARANPVRKAVVRSALRRASLVLTTSRSMANLVAAEFGTSSQRIAVVSWGVDIDEMRPPRASERRAGRERHGLPAHATVLTAIRTLSETYRTLDLVHALADASPPATHLVLLHGHTPADGAAAARQDRYRAATVAAASRLPAESWTIVDRTLDGPDFRALLAATDIAVSIPTSDQRSTSVLEALGMGLTVVGPELPAYRELVEDGFAMELLEEPIEPALRRWLGAPHRLSEAERSANVALIRTSEDRSTRFAEMELAIASRR